MALVSLQHPLPRLLSSPVLSPPGALSVLMCCASLCVVPALMRKSTSADGNVGKSGRPTVTCVAHSPGLVFCALNKEQAHSTQSLPVAVVSCTEESPLRELMHLYCTA